jgi:hypothetical protein
MRCKAAALSPSAAHTAQHPPLARMQREKRNTKKTFRMEEMILPRHMFRSNIKLDLIFDKMAQ